MLEEIEQCAICSYEEGHKYFPCVLLLPVFNPYFNSGIRACREPESFGSSGESSTVGHQLLGVYSTRARNVPSTIWVGPFSFILYYTADHVEVASLGQPNSLALYSHFPLYPPLFYPARQKTPTPYHLRTLISFCKISHVALNRITKWMTFLGQLCGVSCFMNLFFVQKAWVEGMRAGGVLSVVWNSSCQSRVSLR